MLVTTFLSASGKRWAVYECVNPDCFFFAIPKHDLLDNIDIQYVRANNTHEATSEAEVSGFYKEIMLNREAVN